MPSTPIAPSDGLLSWNCGGTGAGKGSPPHAGSPTTTRAWFRVPSSKCGAAHVSPQLGHLGDIEPGLMGHDHARRLCEIPLQCLDQLLFLNSIHFVSEPGRG